MNPIDNFRRFVVSSPPWIVFGLSLLFMTVGVFFLAYRINIGTHKEKITANLCLQGTDDNVMMDGSHNLSLPISFTLSNENRWFKNAQNIILTGQLPSSQVGFDHEMGSFTNVTFKSYLKAGDAHCSVGECVWKTCASVYGPHVASLADLLDTCNSTVTSGAYEKDKFQQVSFAVWTPSCSHRSSGFLMLHLSASQIIILLHDSMIARMHLLYTSYFLFFAVLAMILYGMCRKHKHGGFQTIIDFKE